MPLIRKTPKRGFNNNAFRTFHAVVNLRDLEERFEAGAVVNEETLALAGLIRRPYDAVKILGVGTLTKKLAVTVDAASASAKAAIEAAGGSFELRK